MKGPKDIAIAVRSPDNKIIVKREPAEGIIAKYKLNKIPLLRGGLMLIDSMILGVRSLTMQEMLLCQEKKSNLKI